MDVLYGGPRGKRKEGVARLEFPTRVAFLKGIVIGWSLPRTGWWVPSGRIGASRATGNFRPDGQHLAVMQQPVQDGRGHDPVAEHVAPVTERLIRGQQNAAAFVTCGNDLEQQMGGARRHRQVAELVDDEQLRFDQTLKTRVPLLGPMRPHQGQGGTQCRLRQAQRPRRPPVRRLGGSRPPSATLAADGGRWPDHANPGRIPRPTLRMGTRTPDPGGSTTPVRYAGRPDSHRVPRLCRGGGCQWQV